MRIRRFGGSLQQVAYALESLGLVFSEIEEVSISDLEGPAILIVDHGSVVDGHAIFVESVSRSGVSIVDPLLGRKEVRSLGWFESFWRGGGLGQVFNKSG